MGLRQCVANMLHFLVCEGLDSAVIFVDNLTFDGKGIIVRPTALPILRLHLREHGLHLARHISHLISPHARR